MTNNIFLGIDIGATKTIFLTVGFNGDKFKISDTAKYPTPRQERKILKMVSENFKSLAEKYEIAGIGIGFAGPVDFKKGVAIAGPNLKTGKIEFKKYLSKKLRIPVAVENDVKCFLLAESVFGAAKGYKNIVGLTLGTGIGGAIMIDGKLYRGANNFAGEVGHTYIAEDKKFETVASGTGLSNVYKEITGSKLDSRKIIELAKSGNLEALKALEKVAEFLGTGIANAILNFNPEVVVLGGGLAEVDLIVNKAKEYAKKKVFLPSLAQTPVVVSKLGPVAVALGAAWMASNK